MSELYTARNSFTQENLDKQGRCSGCERQIKVGETAFVRRYTNPHNRTITARTILCNLDDCWQTWDEKVYRGIRVGRRIKGQRFNKFRRYLGEI